MLHGSELYWRTGEECAIIYVLVLEF